MKPDQAWETALDRLQTEMPKAAFDRWVQETNLVSYSDGVFTIAAQDAYAREWLENRLSSTANRLLAGIMNQPVEVRFAVPTQAVQSPTNGGGQTQEEPTFSPEQAWQTAFTHLKESTNQANFTRWVEGARFLAYYKARFVIGLPSAEACDWVNKTLGAKITHMLSELLPWPGQRRQENPVEVQFVVSPAQEAEAHPQDPDQTGGDEAAASISEGLSADEADILIKPICASLREIITRPKSVVVVSAYLLRWLPYLGVDQGWFVLAMRQAFYQTHGEKVRPDNCGQTFTVNRRRIARWSGLGDKKVWRYLKQLEKVDQAGNFLAWFMRGTKSGRGKPKIYTFRADMPLTPGDAEALYDWLIENGIRENPLETLKSALGKQPRDILPHPAPPPAERHRKLNPEPRSVQDVVLAAAGIPRSNPSYLPIKKLADDLQIHIQSPSDNLVITHYFILEWLRKLGRIPAWIVTILRDRGFIDHTQGIRRDRITLQNGYTELAKLLSVSERQIGSWLPPLEEMVRRLGENGGSRQPRSSLSDWEKHQSKRGLVSHFLDKEGDVDWSGKEGTTYEFVVKLEDPLTPEHQEIYTALEALLHDSLVSGNPSAIEKLLSELESGLIRESHNSSGNWSSNSTASPGVAPRITQPQGSSPREPHKHRSAKDTTKPEFDARIARLKALLLKHLNPKILTDIKHLLQQHLEELTIQDTDTPKTEKGVGEENHLSWNWDKLLGYSGAADEIRVEILGSSELQRRFLGQALYAYEHRASASTKGIVAPFKFAVSHRRDSPPPEYMELAGLSPYELTSVIKDRFRQGDAFKISDSAFRVAKALGENGFLEVITQTTRMEFKLPRISKVRGS